MCGISTKIRRQMFRYRGRRYNINVRTLFDIRTASVYETYREHGKRRNPRPRNKARRRRACNRSRSSKTVRNARRVLRSFTTTCPETVSKHFERGTCTDTQFQLGSAKPSKTIIFKRVRQRLLKLFGGNRSVEKFARTNVLVPLTVRRPLVSRIREMSCLL